MATNREKFKEVFGLEIVQGATLCDIVTCANCPQGKSDDCNGDDYWDEEYKAPEVE